jgi:hypothetical protein
MNWGERWFLLILVECHQFHQYQHKSPLISTHWVMVNNSTNIKKITSHLNSLSDGQQFHQYQQQSPLTSTHWVMVNNCTNITTNHLSLQLIEWWSTIPPKSTRITSHLNSLSDGQQFYQYQRKSALTSTHELLTITQWVEVRGDCCSYWWNCWPSLNELRWEVIYLILVELLTITQCVKMTGDFYWYWWNWWPSLFKLSFALLICGIDDHHCLNFIFIIIIISSKYNLCLTMIWPKKCPHDIRQQIIMKILISK